MEVSTVPPVVYQSGHDRARWITYFLIGVIIVAPISMLSNYVQIDLLESARRGMSIASAEASANDARQQLIGSIQTLLLIGTATLFLMWFHRAHRNLSALGAKELQHTPGWAVGGFFVPILNLIRPYQVACEIWKASDPGYSDGTSWKSLGTPSVVQRWWWMFLITGFLGNITLRMMIQNPDTIQDLITLSWINLVTDILDIPSAIFAITMVKQIDQRQETRFGLIASMAAPISQPAC